MTWLTTWPADGCPAYAEHETEQQAADHATEIVRSKTAGVATYYLAPDAHETHDVATESDAGAQVDPNPTHVIRGRQIEGERP